MGAYRSGNGSNAEEEGTLELNIAKRRQQLLRVLPHFARTLA